MISAAESLSLSTDLPSDAAEHPVQSELVDATCDDPKNPDPQTVARPGAGGDGGEGGDGDGGDGVVGGVGEGLGDDGCSAPGRVLEFV